MKKKIGALLLLAAGMSLPLCAQKAAIKTNLLYDATATANLGVEFRMAPKWTFDVSGNLNAWKIGEKRWKHWMLQPEARYWFCNAWSGHFLGVHALGGQYNFGHLNLPFTLFGSDLSKLKENRYQGWYGGLGVAYGYSWILGKHWNLEAELGLGWVYTRYDRYKCIGCNKKLDSNRSWNYFGPTKAAINLIYVF